MGSPTNANLSPDQPLRVNLKKETTGPSILNAGGRFKGSGAMGMKSMTSSKSPSPSPPPSLNIKKPKP